MYIVIDIVIDYLFSLKDSVKEYRNIVSDKKLNRLEHSRYK